MKRLVVFSHKLFRQTPAGLQTTGGFTIQMDALSPYFKHVTLCVPVNQDSEFQGVGISNPNISFHPLPYYEGRGDFLRNGLVFRRETIQAIGNADLGLILLPSYVGLLASTVCQRHRFPIFQWIVGNWSENIILHRRTPHTRWVASNIIALFIDWLTKRLTRNVMTFYNGRIIYDQDKSYHHIRTSSSIRADDINPRQKGLQSPYNLLFVGRLSPEKGISYLLEAMALMGPNCEDVILNIAGTGELENVLEEQTKRLAITHRVLFHGYVPIGEGLFNLYRSSDMLILPSLEDQQPKVLLEGMSQSLPVIATNVGGIPSIIQDGVNGLLIPPGQPDEIVKACKRILTDDELRQRLVSEGLKFAKAHTVESETESMMKLVEAHFN